MTTGFTPPTGLSVETGTPPSEWSESLLVSSAVRDTPAAFSEAPAKTYNPEKKSQEESQASNMLKSQQASHLTSKDREEPHVSLPSTELKGAQPLERTSGVGALPGNLSESSVALLPDERQERMEELLSASSRQRRDTIKPSAAADETRESTMESQTQIPPLSEGKPVTSKLSDVPLQGTEAGVAEAGQSDVAASGPRVGSREETREIQVGEQQTAAAVSATAEDQDTGGASRPDQEQSASQGVQRGEEGEKAEPVETVKEGYGGNYHPATLHPPPPGASAAEFQSPVIAKQESTPAAGTSHQTTEGAEKKPGFMTMVKGEMKIIAGKVRGDEHKVAEGRKLVHGEA